LPALVVCVLTAECGFQGADVRVLADLKAASREALLAAEACKDKVHLQCARGCDHGSKH
jgi:hypothetical protein